MGDVELLNRFMDEYARIYDKVWDSDPILELKRQLARAVDLLRSLSPLADRARRLGEYTTPVGNKCMVYMRKWFYLQDRRGTYTLGSITSPETVIKIIKEHHWKILSFCRDEIRPMAEEAIPLACQLETDLGGPFYHEIDPPKRIFIVGRDRWKKLMNAIRIGREASSYLALQVYVYDPERGRYEWEVFPLNRKELNMAVVLMQLEDDVMALTEEIRRKVEGILRHNEGIIQKIREVVAPRYIAAKLKGEEFPLDSPIEL